MDDKEVFSRVEEFRKVMKWSEEDLELFLVELKKWSRQREYEKIAKERSISQRTGTILEKMGCPNHLRGFAHLQAGIRYVMDNPDASESQIYEHLIDKFHSTPIRMRATIDNAIAKIFEANTPTLQELLRLPNYGYDTHEHLIKSIVNYLDEIEDL